MPYGYEESREWLEQRRKGNVFGNYVDEALAAQNHVMYSGFHQSPQRGNHVTAGPNYVRSNRQVQYDVPQAVRTIVRSSRGENLGEVVADYVNTHSLRFLDSMISIEPYYPTADNSIAASITQALNRLPTNSAQLGADMGEARQVVDMFASDVIRLASAIRAARLGNWYLIPGLLGISKASVLSGKFPANLWLEYIYGWKPLMSSIFQAQQKVHDELVKDRLVAASATDQASQTSERVTVARKYKLDTKASARTTLIGRMTRPELANVNSWGLLNPLSIAWELTPFSFVVDWFAPVGNTLSACTAGYGLEFVDGYTSLLKSFEYSAVGIVNDLSNSKYETQVLVNPGSVGIKGRDFLRYPHFNFPTPQLYADTTPFSTARAVNAAALVRQLL